MPTYPATEVDARSAYLADYPRTGQLVTLYLDGTGKPKNFDRYVMARDLGQYGLVDRSRPTKHGLRVATVDAADLDELLDEVLEALWQLQDEQGGERGTGPQASLAAIALQVQAALA